MLDYKASNQYSINDLMKMFSILESSLSTVLSDLDLQSIMQQVADSMVKDMDYPGGVVLLCSEDAKGKYAYPYTFSNIPITHLARKFFNAPLLRYYFSKKGKNYIEKTGVTKDIYISHAQREHCSPQVPNWVSDSTQKISRTKTSITIPIIAKNDVVGVLFINSHRPSISNEEMLMLRTYSNQMGLAINHSKLYKQTESQLTELAEKNRYLTTLQRITKQVIQGTNYREIAQKIVDSIHREMGYPGAFILSYEQLTNEVWLEAVTNNDVFTGALDLIEGDAFAIRGTVTPEDRVIHRILSDKQVSQTDKLSACISPGVPASVADAIQKFTKTVSYTGLPIIVNDTVYGALIFSHSQKATDVTETEQEMMLALADLVAIVIRNSRAFTEIEQSNKKLQKAYQMINDQLCQLEDANKHLRQLDSAKTEFLSIASHQLRTPISVVKGYVSMLLDGDYGSLDPKITDILEKSAENITRLSHVVGDILNVARIDAGRLQLARTRVDLREMVSDAIDELRLKAEAKGLKINWDPTVPADVPLISLDKEKMQQVIINLIDNAIAYTVEGSIGIQILHTPKTVSILVKDTGIGIPKADQDKIFDKFTRADNAQKLRPDGTGIGLHVVKTIVDAHDGTIDLESDTDKGCCITVTIPIISESAEKADSAELIRKAQDHIKKQQEKQKI